MTFRRAVLPILLALASCDQLPPLVDPGMTLECGPMRQGDCQASAARLVAEAARSNPGKRVVSIRFVDERGSYDLMFDDGSGMGMIVD